jgi:hypothetical protein
MDRCGVEAGVMGKAGIGWYSPSFAAQMSG